MPDYLNLRLNKEALGDAERYADSIGYSMPQFIGECVRAVTQMIESSDRRVPLIVNLVDAAGVVPPALSSSPTSRPEIASIEAAKVAVTRSRQKSATGATIVRSRPPSKSAQKPKAPRR